MRTFKKLQVRLPSNEHTALRILSLQENKTLSEEAVEILEAILRGEINIEVEEDAYQATSILAPADVLEQFNKFAKERGMPSNKMFRLGVAARLKQARNNPDNTSQ